MEEVAQELAVAAARVELGWPAAGRGTTVAGHLDLLVHMGEEQNFVYQIGRSNIAGAGLYLPRT